MLENNLYKYAGAKALVELHEIHLLSLYENWKKAKQFKVKLPTTEDQYYKSLDTLLFHVLQSARGYMIWICEKLQLDDPLINETPVVENIEEKAEEHISHLIEKWGLPLINVEPELFEDKVYKSNWGVDYCIDAMLEHAVMHPIRHEFQIKDLIAEQKNKN